MRLGEWDMGRLFILVVVFEKAKIKNNI